MKALGFFLGMVFLPLLSFSGPISSGGGTVVVCNDNGNTSVQLLEYFEAIQLYGESEVVKGSGDWIEDYKYLVAVSYGIKGFEIDYDRLPELDHDIEDFFQLVEWVESDDLPTLNDHGKTVQIPANCSLKLAALFLDDQRKIKLARDLWVKMDSINKAALLQHEILYRMDRELGAETSKVTRLYVRMQFLKYHNIFDDDKLNMNCWTQSRMAEPSIFDSYDILQSEYLFGFGPESQRDLGIHDVQDVRYDHFGNSSDSTDDDLFSENESAAQSQSDNSEWEFSVHFSGGPVTMRAFKDGHPIGIRDTVCSY